MPLPARTSFQDGQETLPVYAPLEEAVRFERTDPCGSPGFKAGALSRTRPYFHVLYFTPDKGHNAERRNPESDWGISFCRGTLKPLSHRAM
jgi:hypothetical protein